MVKVSPTGAPRNLRFLFGHALSCLIDKFQAGRGGPIPSAAATGMRVRRLTQMLLPVFTGRSSHCIEYRVRLQPSLIAENLMIFSMRPSSLSNTRTKDPIAVRIKAIRKSDYFSPSARLSVPMLQAKVSRPEWRITVPVWRRDWPKDGTMQVGKKRVRFPVSIFNLV